MRLPTATKYRRDLDAGKAGYVLDNILGPCGRAACDTSESSWSGLRWSESAAALPHRSTAGLALV